MEVKGFENYIIYPDGKIKSKARKGTPERILKQCDNGKGYLMVRLTNSDGNRISKRIHRLIAEHYIPNPDNKPQVDHKNRIKTDNRIENLRWVTNQENQLNKGFQINKSVPFKFIGKNKDGYYSYQRRLNKKLINSRLNKSLSKILCYSFFYILKHPI